MGNKIEELKAMEKEQLIGLIDTLQEKLKGERSKLHLTRKRLTNARVKLKTMQDIVKHQRSRILELYRREE